jgi:hypothetical protein
MRGAASDKLTKYTIKLTMNSVYGHLLMNPFKFSSNRIVNNKDDFMRIAGNSMIRGFEPFGRDVGLFTIANLCEGVCQIHDIGRDWAIRARRE